MAGFAVTHKHEAMTRLLGQVAPVALAGDQTLPVLAPLARLFPGGALRRGSVVGVSGGATTGMTSLLLAVLAGPSEAGSWTAVVGMAALGAVAAAEMGVDLARCALVPDAGPSWPVVVAALLDALDVVVVRPPGRARAADARRLSARARERGSVLVVAGSAWPEGPDVWLTVAASSWVGLGRGHGALSDRHLQVVAGGRGAAAKERRATIEFPLRRR